MPPQWEQIAVGNGKWQLLTREIWSLVQDLSVSPAKHRSEPNTSQITVPLPGFCSFNGKLYKAAPVSWDTSRGSFWDFVQAVNPPSIDALPRWEAQILNYVANSCKGPGSPFTRLVEEILDMQSQQIQLSFLKVVWLEKLLAWKMRTFGLQVYLTRTALPMTILFSLHLTIGILVTRDQKEQAKNGTVPVTMLACVELGVSFFVLLVKLRQCYRIPRLFLRSVFNHIEVIAVYLGFIMFLLVVSEAAISRAFLGFSTLSIWVATILMLRTYRPVGMLLLLLTETYRGVFSFLALLFFIILGLAAIP